MSSPCFWCGSARSCIHREIEPPLVVEGKLPQAPSHGYKMHRKYNRLGVGVHH